MNVKIDFNRIITTLVLSLILGSVGFFFDFQGVKATVRSNERKIKNQSSRIDLVAYMLCEDKLEKDPENAPKVCLKLLAQFNKDKETL